MGISNANPQSALTSGYNAAIGSLNKSLKLSQNDNSAQIAQAGQQLNQNQGRVQQGLINSGLGNTTVAQTMQQAPLQTYNQQVDQLHNNLQQQQSSIMGQQAGVEMQGGSALSNLLAAFQMQDAAKSYKNPLGGAAAPMSNG